jgi:hypothetical protein
MTPAGGGSIFPGVKHSRMMPIPPMAADGGLRKSAEGDMAEAGRQPDTPAAGSTHRLIPSDRVEGTAVRRSSGEKIGEIKRLMIDKVSGKVAYAVMSFGGFLGMGEKYHPLPWDVLHYNTTLEAYELNIPDEQLRNAPSYGTSADFDWGDRDRERRLHDYYKVPPYWGV